MNKLIQTMINYLYPARCVFCGKVMEKEMAICTDCETEVKKLRVQVESVLQGLPLHYLEAVYAYSVYGGVVKQGMHRLKFEGVKTLAPVYGEMMAELLKNVTYNSVVAVVPPSEKRSLYRDYNVPALLAETCSAKKNIPYLENILQKDYETPTQHALSRTDRLANLTGVFSVTDAAQITGKTVYLCDDIVTTGATLDECAKTLKIFGAKEVIGVCFAATPDKK